MPTRKTKTAAAQGKKVQPAEAKAGGRYAVPAVIIIVVIAIAAVLGYLAASGGWGGGGGGQESFQAFQSSLYAAPRAAIYVTYLNGSTFSYSAGCAYSLIEGLIASRTNHRNASTLDFLIIANSTSCFTPNGVLGSSNGTRIVPISSCLAVSAHEPSIFINYSSVNSTVIRSGNLYTSGDDLFLSECGIASELG